MKLQAWSHLPGGIGNLGLWGGLLATILVMSGCNSLFYHPDQVGYGDPSQIGLSYRDFRISMGAETDVHGWEVEPRGEEKAFATVLHFHGNAQNMSAHFSFVEWLLNHGIEVVTFDYRGYGQSKGKPSREGTVEDGIRVLEHVAAGGRGQNLFVLGQSLGGAVAVTSLSKSMAGNPLPGLRGIILESTFASYRRLARKKVASLWLLWPLQYPLSFLVSNELSPDDHLTGLESLAWLQFHGDQDPVVPLESGQKLFNAAEFQAKSGAPREFIVIPGGGHTTALVDPQRSQRGRVIDFVCENSLEPRGPVCSSRQP